MILKAPEIRRSADLSRRWLCPTLPKPRTQQPIPTCDFHLLIDAADEAALLIQPEETMTYAGRTRLPLHV